MDLMPVYTTTTEIQRNFKLVQKKAKKAKDGVVVLSNNNPIGVYTEYQNYLNNTQSNSSANADLLSLVGAMSNEEVVKLNKDIDDMFEKVDEEEWK